MKAMHTWSTTLLILLPDIHFVVPYKLSIVQIALLLILLYSVNAC